MLSSKVCVRQENLLTMYFYERLKNGITEGVMEDEFKNLMTMLQEGNELCHFEPESFEGVVNKANNMNAINTAGILLKEVKGDLIAEPTYNLKMLSPNRYNDGAWVIQKDIIKKDVESKKMPFIYNVETLDCYKGEIISIAKKVASFFVNDSIERYVASQIQKGRWPIQCENIDEYIFAKDIARYINEDGTRKTLQQVYVHSIGCVCDTLKERQQDEAIQFSNNPYNLLAFSNFIKFYLPSQFSFLSSLVYNEYENNKKINVYVGIESLSFSSLCTTYSDPYGEWGDEYLKKQGVIDDACVEIMEKRVGII